MSFLCGGARVALVVAFVFFFSSFGAGFRFNLSGLPFLDLYEQRLRNLNSSASDNVNDIERVATHLPCRCTISSSPISAIKDGSNFRGVLVSFWYLFRSE
ncbi:hypothetical protein BZL54_12780 [Burkholderia ubonensis subsp. mesacidophila]|uniref:Uncharacterized protein n=1 Tax=Burkholderia ubonensis subsp. mesacidophila TaxID=265293 RepID=A0A2A4FEZ7_9BURK|nr:hypothetical protein BZL54_12780 [Burkholderia ubonensis subsp. mesacidophila]